MSPNVQLKPAAEANITGRRTTNPTSNKFQNLLSASDHMKTLGLIGGIGWESTAAYYRIINQDVRNRLGSLHSAKLILVNVNFDTLNTLVREARWAEAGVLLGQAAKTLETAGAEGIVLCSNLMHYIAGFIEAAITVPFLHIGDAILEEVREQKTAKLGLVGTRFTLEHGFLLERRSSVRRKAPTVFLPDAAAAARLDAIIYDELCRGMIREQSRADLREMIRSLRKQGAKAIILGSSELSLLLTADDYTQPVYDSTEIHATRAVRWAFDEPNRSIDLTKSHLTAIPGAAMRKAGRPARQVIP